MALLSDLGNWFKKTISPQQVKTTAQKQPTFIDRVQSVLMPTPQQVGQRWQAAGQMVGKALQKVNYQPTFKITNPQTRQKVTVQKPLAGFESIANLLGTQAQSYGKTIESLSTPEQRKKILPSIKIGGKKAIKGDILGSLSEPGVQDVLNISDFVPAGIVAGTVAKGLGLTGKTLLKSSEFAKALDTILGDTKAIQKFKLFTNVGLPPGSQKVVSKTYKAERFADQALDIKKALTDNNTWGKEAIPLKPFARTKEGNAAFMAMVDGTDNYLDFVEKVNKARPGGIGELQRFAKEAGFENMSTMYKRLKKQLVAMDSKIGNIGLTTQGVSKGAHEAVYGAIKDIPTSTVEKPRLITSLYNRFLNSSRNVLHGMGETGKTMANKIDTMYTTAQREAGNRVADLLGVTNKLDDVQNEQLIKGLRGETPKTPLVQQVRKVLDKVYDDAKSVGLDVGYRENYVPQIPDLDKLKLYRDAAIDHFVKTKQFSSQGAANFVDDLLNGNTIREAYSRFGKPVPKKMGNLEFQRILDWIPDVLRTDKKLIPDYIEEAYARINQIRQFGKNGEIGTEILDNLTKQGHDAKLAQTILDQNLGLVRYDRAIEKASGVIRSVQGAMKLPLAGITNATQSVNTATVGGTKRTLQQLFRYANPAERKVMEDYALRTGATLTGELKQIIDQWKGGKTPIERLIAPGFQKIEKFNRVLAANVGRAKAMAEGITNEDDLLRAGQKMVDATQFQVRPIDMPTMWNTPGGKVATQFKSFAFKQTGFVAKEVLGELKKGNVAPLARFLLLGTLIGEVANSVKAQLSGRDRESMVEVLDKAKNGDPLPLMGRIVENSPGVGYYQDLVEAIAYGLSYPGGLDKAIIDFVAGPTGADVRKGIANTGTMLGGNPKPMLKELANNIPFIGRPLVNANKNLFTSKRNIKISPQIEKKTTNGTDEFISSLGTGPLEKQKLKDQISLLNTQKKEIYDKAGVNIPLVGTFGKPTDVEKTKQMNDIDAKLTKLKEKQKLMEIDTPAEKLAFKIKEAKKIVLKTGEPQQIDNTIYFKDSTTNKVTSVSKTDYEKKVADAEYSLASDKLKRAKDWKGWVSTTESYIDTLQSAVDRLKSPNEEPERIRLQNKIEDLKTQVEKYKGYGGFTKGKKPKKVSVKKITLKRMSAPKARKSKFPTIKIAKAPKVTNIKIKKPKSLLTNSKNKSIKIKRTKLG